MSLVDDLDALVAAGAGVSLTHEELKRVVAAIRASQQAVERQNGLHAQYRVVAEAAAQKYAPSGDALCMTWQGLHSSHAAHYPGVRPLPEEFDYNEAVAAIVSQLNREGVPAWNGDAVWCVAHMLNAQWRRYADLKAQCGS